LAVYRASHDDYHDNSLPTGQPCGDREDALECAAGPYITEWQSDQSPTN
jgi:hypothetical protein